MQKHIDEKGNIIYGDLNLQRNLRLNFSGSNNIVFFAGSSVVNINFIGSSAVALYRR
ncbi:MULTISPECIES: hypothetical protein [unclassified Campylobacter]|uniref:hypothetical protein n=1 Tax=unclassified Campylobacter TaxID=2593542 RepID=UPI0016803205|nr:MULTISPECIES: hypothetical protein [unclassified Campylobacter]